MLCYTARFHGVLSPQISGVVAYKERGVARFRKCKS